MTKLFVFGLALLATAAFSHEQAQAKSVLFTLSNDWIPCGKPPYGDDVYWWQKPWEQEQIIIYSASLDLILNKAGGGDLMVGGMIGNSTEPDPVTPLKMAVGQGPMLTLHNEMPANAVPMRYGGSGDTNPHLDVHIPVCPQGAAVKGYIWVSYQLASQAGH
jgi:hypothetical protein